MRLKGYLLIEGVRRPNGVDSGLFVSLIINITKLLESNSHFVELDLNPLMASGTEIVSVDARIRVEKDGSGETSEFGDISTLLNPECVEDIAKNRL